MMATRGGVSHDYPTEPQHTPPVGGSPITQYPTPAGIDPAPDPYTTYDRTLRSAPAGIDPQPNDIPDTPPDQLRWTEPRTVFAAIITAAYLATFAAGWRDRYPEGSLNPFDWAFLGASAMLFGGGGIKDAVGKLRRPR